MLGADVWAPLRPTNRFVDCEAWRKDTNLDDLVPSWQYTEKEQIFKYYPQYYHKTDKVRATDSILILGRFCYGRRHLSL